jgi:hypothetical protein
MDELMGIAEIAKFCGLTRGTVGVYHSQGKLPPHDYETARQKLWLPETIRQWAVDGKIGRFK